MRTRYTLPEGTLDCVLAGDQLHLSFDDMPNEVRTWRVPPLMRGHVIHAMNRPNRPELMHAVLDKLDYGS